MDKPRPDIPVIGHSDEAQLRKNYSPALAKAIRSALQTKLVMRVPDGDSARKYAEAFGSKPPGDGAGE